MKEMTRVLKLSAPWCGPCKQMDAQLDRLKMIVEHIDLDVDPVAGSLYKPRGIPTLVKLDDAGAEIGRLIGAQSDKNLLAFFQ